MSFFFGSSKEEEPAPPNTRSTGRPLHPPLGYAKFGPRSRDNSPQPTEQQQFFPSNPSSPLSLPAGEQFQRFNSNPASPQPQDIIVNPPTPSDFEEEDLQHPDMAESEVERLSRVAEAAIAAATAVTAVTTTTTAYKNTTTITAFEMITTSTTTTTATNSHVHK